MTNIDVFQSFSTSIVLINGLEVVQYLDDKGR